MTGSGDKVAKFAIPEGMAAIATITHRGTRNFAVLTLAADGSHNELLVNEIGTYSGTVLFDARSGTHSVAFEITADGRWTIAIKPVAAARTWTGAGDLAGKGDDVVRIDPPSSGLTVAMITHSGSRNFAVIGYSSSGFPDLMVNEIGNYSGETTIAEGTFLLQVTADGTWSVAAS